MRYEPDHDATCPARPARLGFPVTLIARPKAASLAGHADFVRQWKFIGFMREVDVVEFYEMPEAKAKDLALLRLRADLVDYTPEVAEHFGLATGDAKSIRAEAAETPPAG